LKLKSKINDHGRRHCFHSRSGSDSDCYPGETAQIEPVEPSEAHYCEAPRNCEVVRKSVVVLPALAGNPVAVGIPAVALPPVEVAAPVWA